MRPTHICLWLVITSAIVSCNGKINYPEGGYAYPTTIKDSNYYWYPLRDSINKKHKPAEPYDFLYRFFDEPNLSLHPMPQETFRFFLVGFKQWPLIIVLTEKQIVVKKALTDEFWVKDTSKFTKIEMLHYKILCNDYHYSEYSRIRWSQKSHDSLLKLYPYMFRKEYRTYLENKAVKIPNNDFRYKTQIIAISKKQYRQLVTGINNSGYWKLPYYVHSTEQYMDGFEYRLEANTPKKYNVVGADDINDEKQFAKACQALIDTAGMGKKYSVYREVDK